MVADPTLLRASCTRTVGERAYRSIKQLLFDSTWPAGTRLDIVHLADLARVSTTPVRESLARLAAERLVDNRAGTGFFVPRPAVVDLKRLYGWHGRLAIEAIDGAPGAARLDPTLPYSALAAALFGRISAAATDSEVQHALRNAEERLRGLRLAEDAVVTGAAAEVIAISCAWADGDRAGARRELARRSRRLAAAAADILDRASRSDIRDIGG